MEASDSAPRTDARAPLAPGACFVSGVRDDDGEHLASLALVHALRAQRLSVAAMTPVALCCKQRLGRWVSPQLQHLAQVGTFGWPVSAICPYPLPMAGTPAEAARLAGIVIDPEVVLDTLQVLSTWTEIVVVQGVGGLTMPIGPDMTVQHLVARLGLPLILALQPGPDGEARAREAAVHAVELGLRVVAWVATPIDTEAPTTMIARMQRALGDAPCLGILRRRSNAEADVAAIAARALDGPRLVTVLHRAVPCGDESGASWQRSARRHVARAGKARPQRHARTRSGHR